MFTIKVTYRGQTRKVTFQDHDTFPSYFEISTQVYRLFPITQGFALSKLLFSPNASFSSRNILISKEVRYADDYARCIRPFKDFTWSNGLLKFVIVDIDVPDLRTPQEQSTVPSDESYSSWFPPSPLHAMEVDQSPTGATPAQHPEIPLQHKSSMSSFSSCCSVAESKAEIKSMLDDFQVGLNRVLSSNLQEPLLISPPNTRDSCSGAETGSNTWRAPSKCSHCTESIVPSGDGSLFCEDCGVVCEACHHKIIDCPKVLGSNKPIKGPGATFPVRPLPSHPQRPHPAPFVSSTNMIPPEHRSPVLNSDSSHPVVHAGIMCDVCYNTIRGVRHKCLDCRDYDLCTRCITTGFAERHNPFHEFYEIREPGRVVVHTVVSGEQQRAVPATSTQNNSVHTASCDLCDSGITGDRYKCAVCPDFDTCSSCFTITNDQHPNHTFVKITKREDIIRRDVEQHVHSAICDACTQTIYGNRFKCMHPSCPDYDLCQNCEALPIAVHPTNHPMLKIKTPCTAVPTVRRFGSVHASGSITPTRSTGPEIGTSSPETPVGVTRAATPTPASAGLVTCVSVHDWLSPPNNQSNSSFIPTSPPKASSMDPFADIFSVERPVPPPLPREDAIGMVNPWPTTDVPERDGFLRLIAELSGNISPQSPSKPEADVPKEDGQQECSERPALMDHSDIVPVALPGVVYDEPPAITQTIPHPTIIVPESADTVSDRQPPETVLSEGNDLSAEISAVLAKIVRELPTLVPPPVTPSVEAKITVPRISLSAAFVEDATVPDGQVFPPGAEFVKCWRLINDCGCEWPESTELVFVAGDSLSASASVEKGIAVPVGKTGPGETIDVWTGELKAPDLAGRYVGYWRLRANGVLFGNSLWVDINVVEADSSEESMAASSVIMPAASSGPNSERVPSVIATTLSTQTYSLASVTDDNLSDAGSDMSLISMPSSPSDDEVWHETKSAPSNLSKDPSAAPGSAASTPATVGMDYVLLYDDESSDEERK